MKKFNLFGSQKSSDNTSTPLTPPPSTSTNLVSIESEKSGKSDSDCESEPYYSDSFQKTLLNFETDTIELTSDEDEMAMSREEITAALQTLQAEVRTISNEKTQLQNDFGTLKTEHDTLTTNYETLRTSYNNLQARVVAGGNHDTVTDAIRKSFQRIVFCDGKNINAFITEVRTLMEDYNGTENEIILRHAKRRIEDIPEYKQKDFTSIDELEHVLKLKYTKIKTLNTVEYEMTRLRMRTGESIGEYAKRAKKLKEDKWTALHDYWMKNDIIATPSMKNGENKRIIEGFLTGLRDDIKISMRNEYETLDGAISHAEEISAANSMKNAQHSKPGTSNNEKKVSFNKMNSHFKKSNNATAAAPNTGGTRKCYECKSTEHQKKDCPLLRKAINSKN